VPGFQRRAKWLNFIFPASEAPTVSDPGVRSGDVSLVQQYDGGGFGFQDPASHIIRKVIAVGATGTVDMLETSAEEIFRLVSADVINIAGGGTPTAFLTGISLASLDSCDLATVQLPTTGRPLRFPNLCPIVGPSTRIVAQYLSGDAAQQLSFAIMGFRAPLGTAFSA